ncbi:NAD(P)/FAD-dependent oxidoreductase [Brevundimonas sp.]|uniref:NAD(P)/FAD-dependent oxidoreductase n=1 Tax=Brevundimonas sp. TaxID=1871086 RepID=UPI0025C6428E|nr:FAD-dependent oxidoreductase [Brevundimonas sp.]
MTSSPPIVIVGAGVLGLCTAFALKQRGHAVRVVDPGGPNASAVAAGMIAPAMESAIDDLSPDQARLLKAGRDLWPAFAQAAGIVLTQRPAEWRGGQADRIAARLAALGFDAARDGDRVITTDDWQVQPHQAMTALKTALGEAVVMGEVAEVQAMAGGWRIAADGRWIVASGLVVATGAAPALTGLPAATCALIDVIQPIRGQIGVTRALLADRVTRGPGAYVAPMGDRVVVGATMEPGRRDTTPDEQTGRRMLEAAWRVLGRSPQSLDIQWRAGVRGATADGLPLAGPAPDGESLFMALAPRRNGWLLGPLAGSAVADWIEGRAPSPDAHALDPRRF